MKTTKTAFPQSSILYRIGRPYDYADSYRTTFSDPDNRITTTEVGRAFFSSAPGWVKALFAVRNSIGAGLGLKTGGSPTHKQELPQDFNPEPGQRVGLFKVFSKTDTELVLGEDDSHLNFRLSLLLTNGLTKENDKHLILTTVVEFHNKLGRLYFLPVKPLHKLIVPAMLTSMATQLEQPRVIQL
ncbi:hypothetical protein D770_11620 [Flammeovirgaceae bacterium 311]|nr:hypothetical protein D770_11620 [Flammeovirgaceae bacterium 311]